MCSDVVNTELAIKAEGLTKFYQLFQQPADRLKQMLSLGRRRYAREFWALREVDFSVNRGEVVGVIGRNGAGKSTLLQLICGTLQPSSGSLQVNGRIAALLELGAGFNPEFSGRDNVFLNAAILGLSHDEIAARYDDIVEFSGIGAFIDQPVKTYSSGMYVRLAFAVAISVDPDILIIDEALSVGDGDFSRKSFDRIMALKDAGKTILFCSHSTYQIEAICNRAIWLNEGRVEMIGQPASVVSAYNTFLAGLDSERYAQQLQTASHDSSPAIEPSIDVPVATPVGMARIVAVNVSANGVSGHTLAVNSLESTVSINIDFVSDPQLPPPSIAVGILLQNGSPVASAGSFNDGVTLSRRADGAGAASLILPALPLLKGDYFLNVFLLCERGVHVYDHADRVALLQVTQHGLEQGLVSLPHSWEVFRE